MKLLLDMNLSPLWQATLVNAGFETVLWSSVGMANAPDPEIMHYAELNGYTVCTQDLDFGIILAATGRDRPSELLGVTSEQYSRIENGSPLTLSNDKLVRLLVITLSVIEAFKKPELMERVAKQTWTSHVGPDQRIIAKVDAVQGWTVETKAA